MVATSVPGVTRRSTAPSMLLRSDDLEGEWLSHTLDAIEVQGASPSLEEEWLSATLQAMPATSMPGVVRRCAAPSMLLRSVGLEGEWLSATLQAMVQPCCYRLASAPHVHVRL